MQIYKSLALSAALASTRYRQLDRLSSGSNTGTDCDCCITWLALFSTGQASQSISLNVVHQLNITNTNLGHLAW